MSYIRECWMSSRDQKLDGGALDFEVGDWYVGDVEPSY